MILKSKLWGREVDESVGTTDDFCLTGSLPVSAAERSRVPCSGGASRSLFSAC